MDNLSFENIAIGTVIVGILNLIIVILVKTETILKYIEKVKGVIGLDYKDRAKRSDDELRITKKHLLVAKDRVRHSFIRMKKWNCSWVWNWSEEFEPINIKGYCLGDKFQITIDKIIMPYSCNHPIDSFYFHVDTIENNL